MDQGLSNRSRCRVFPYNYDILLHQHVKDLYTLEDNPIIYSRLEKETDKAWEAFQVYRDFGKKRSLAKVADKLNKSKTIIARWSTLYNWVNRISQFEQTVDSVSTRQALMDRQAARIRQLRIANKMQGLGESQIDKHAELAEKADAPILEADKASKIAAEGIKIERLIHGDPTEINENRNTDIDWSRLEAEEIKVFKALVIKLKGDQNE